MEQAKEILAVIVLLLVYLQPLVEVVEPILALMLVCLADLVEVNVIPIQEMDQDQEMLEEHLTQLHQAVDGEMMVEKL